MFQQQDFKKALEAYSQALSIPGAQARERAILYGNRSACFSAMGAWNEALNDAISSSEEDMSYPKGPLRIAVALEGLGRVNEAQKARLYAEKLIRDEESFKTFTLKV